MPQVTLDLVSLDNKPLVGMSRVFEGSGGTIGRDEGNTLALPDARRRVSRLHATISFPGGVPTITNSSSVLTIGVGGMQLESGQALALVPGMNLTIGPYVLAVRAHDASARPAPLPADPSASSPMRQPLAAASAQAVAAPSGAAAAHASSSRAPAANAIGMLNGVPSSPGIVPAPAFADPFADLLAGLAPAPAGLASAPPVSPQAAPAAPMSPVDDPLAALLGQGGSAAPPMAAASVPVAMDPFAALLAGSAPAANPAGPVAVDPFAAMGAGSGPAPAAADPMPAYSRPADVIPEDFNPFELPSASARNSADPLSSMLGGAGGPAAPQALTQGEESIDGLFAPAAAPGVESLLGGAASAGPFGDISGQPASLLAQPDNSDPLALFGGASSGREGLSRPMRDDLAEVGGAYQPPRALDPLAAFAPAAPSRLPPLAGPDPFQPQRAQPDPFQPAAMQPAPMQRAATQPAAMPSYPADALTRAFLAGANLPPTALPNGLTPEIMTMVGGLLRSATAGAVDMLAIRANIKREIQASVTIIASEANNPLKFLLDADSVLLHFLGKKMPGFMLPDEAMKDAFNDLRAHELGVIAGTRAALGEVLTKFDPALLGERLIRGSLLEMALPAMRKTKLWDLYLEQYAQLRREVEDDFQSVFGKAFVAAYEQASARMKAGALARET